MEPTSPPDAIAVLGLTRIFNGVPAVAGIDLMVRSGDFLGFLGPNGAGKSTTIKMLTGLLAPTSGSIRILGTDLLADPVAAKRLIGVVPESLALFGKLTAAEHLEFVGRMYGLPAAVARDRAAELLGFMELTADPRKLLTDFSHGMRKKLALAAAVIHRPRVLFLDEPFEGVDTVAARALKGLLSKLVAGGVTVFLTSHVLETVESLCTSVAIINKGRLVAHGSLDELRAGIPSQGAAPGADPPTADPLTLEQIFLSVVGAANPGSHPQEELPWLR